MSDSFTEVTNRSIFARIKSALGGIVFGFFLVLASIAALFWNEGRAVKTATALNEGAGQVKSIDPAAPPAELNGKLVHFSGSLKPGAAPKDTTFGAVVAPEGSVRLERKVEMYQWKQSSKSEKRKKIGGGEETITVYTYAKTWSDRPIDSSRFKKPSGHQNPAMPARGETFRVESGTVGALNLSGNNIAGLGSAAPIPPNFDQLEAVQDQLNSSKTAQINGNVILLSDTPNSPAVGDLRVSWSAAKVDTISVVGQMKDSTIVPFTATNGREISMFQSGRASAKEMFDTAISNNTMLTWALRVGGFIAMWIGFKMIFSVIGVVGDIIPFVGDVFRFATGIVGFALAAIISSLVIGTAWIYYRPTLGISIIAAGLILAVGAFVIGKAKAKQQKGTLSEAPA